MHTEREQHGDRKFIHIDMDCFFAAIEMRDNPHLRDVPIAIGGSVESRGVVCTANYPARKYGVRSALSTAKALRLCPDLTLIQPRMALYESVSEQMHAIFARYTPYIEPVSLDEAYLDVSQCSACRGSATLIAQEIRNAIENELQLTASAGVAPAKFLAKIASDYHKPNGQFVIAPHEVDDFVKALPLRKIPGIGPKTEERLQALGLKTCGDVQQWDLAEIIKEFGKFGIMIWDRCHGRDDTALCVEQPRKTVGVELTLPQDIHQWSECEAIIKQLYPELKRRLFSYSPQYKISRQGVKYKFSDFHLTTHEHMFPVLNQADLLKTAKKAWDERRANRGVRLVGLNVTLPDPQLERQLPLLW
ncbi:DNA polymerase IV [Photobacterium halotolerans]|uniref:DNA polymerase IV n=1 Tax=Photobacterium halotolerans TaxID=265726 RepID=A0A0F5VBN3_9GAMM|nr:DNA polymerase IV [Photobacterium halotolerans]KKC99507.1 DNA polymerase IV [Photobacterium halotolerans]